MRLLNRTIAASLVLGFAGSASAALLNASVSTGVASPVDLTAAGNQDWAIFDATANGDGELLSGSDSTMPANIFSFALPEYNAKSSGSGINSAVIEIAAGANFTSDTSPIDYSYTDGTSPVSETTAGGLGLAVRTNLAEAQGPNGRFVFEIAALDTVNPTTVTVYGAHKRAGVDFVASLNGVADDVDVLAPIADTTSFAYTVTFTPDNIGDLLTLSFGTNGQSTAASNNFNTVRVSGIAVNAIPEPATAALCGLGGLMLLRRRA